MRLITLSLGKFDSTTYYKMKKILLFTILMSSLSLTSCHNADNASSPAADKAIENIMTRTSVRVYTDEAISDPQLETMLKAAMAAPTAVNKQPWAFVVVKSKDTLKALSDSIPSMAMAKKAPVAIIVCGDMTKALDGEGHDYWVQDVSAATENLLLAANAQGLGAVWCGVYPVSSRVAFISDLLGLPDHIVPLAVVPVGHPAATPAPKDKWDPAKIHNEKW